MIDALMPVAGVKMPIQAKQEQGVISMWNGNNQQICLLQI